MQTPETPICDALFQHAAHARGALHVPGHQQGALFPRVLDLWLGNASKLDLTELPGLDNLAQPHECILMSQKLAAKHYGSEQCLYSVNGSSAGIMASLLATASTKSTVLFLNPFHISAWHGLVHSGAGALRIPGAYDREGRQKPVNPELVRKTLEIHPEIDVVYLTSPTYQGDCTDVTAVTEEVHRRGLPLIVDEAHGAHFGLIPQFPKSGVQAGADVVVQSVHKMLPGLTQTAWVHRQGERVDGDRLFEALRSLQTTSPSYLLLASLDAAQYWLRSEGPQVATDTVNRLADYGLTTRPKTTESDRGEAVQRDPLKHWVPAPSPSLAQDFSSRLQNKGLYVEYTDSMGVLSILGLGIRERTLQDYTVILRAWRSSPEFQKACETATSVQGAPEDTQVRAFAIPPREAVLTPKKRVLLDEAENRVLAAPLVPYPPGIPVLYPGDLLTRSTVRLLAEWLNQGREIHGIDEKRQVFVVR